MPAIVSTDSLEQRLEDVFRLALPKLSPLAREQVQALIDPTALASIASVLLAWVVSHALGLGEIIDIIILVIGAATVSLSVFLGLEQLFDFAERTCRARTPQDLEGAAESLAMAINTLGTQAVLAVLFRGARMPRSGRGAPIAIGTPPPVQGIRYRPSLTEDRRLDPGTGTTDFWGNVTVSPHGTELDRALVRLHERVHQALSPKLVLLREYRAGNRAHSYLRSSLWRYLEEALAETIARVGVLGMSEFFNGLRFPVGNGYVYLCKGGGFNPLFTGAGVIPEAAGLLYHGVVSGFAYELRSQPTNPRSTAIVYYY